MIHILEHIAPFFIALILKRILPSLGLMLIVGITFAQGYVFQTNNGLAGATVRKNVNPADTIMFMRFNYLKIWSDTCRIAAIDSNHQVQTTSDTISMVIANRFGGLRGIRKDSIRFYINNIQNLQSALDAKYNASNPSNYIDATALSPYLSSAIAANTYQPMGTYATASNAMAFTNKTGNISMWNNDAGYLTNITSGQIATALGYTSYNGTTNPNSYITTAGAKSAISLTNTGTSGATTYNNSTGVLNVPIYANSGGTITSVTSADANATIATTTTTPIITIASAPKLQTARNIQGVSFDGTGNINPINGTGFVKSSGTTLNYDNSTYLTGNQTISLSGDATGSGTTSIITTLANSGISAGTYVSATYDVKGRATAGSNPVIDTLSASRSFNTAYLISSTKYVDVRISARITCTLSLSGGQEGSITLQTSPDASTWTSVGTLYGANTGSLTIGLNTSNSVGGQLSVLLAPGYYWKVLTTNVTGTPTFTMAQGNKITY